MRFRTGALFLATLGILYTGCTPETPSSGTGPIALDDPGSAVEAREAEVDPVIEAERILGERFAGTGLIESVVSIEMSGTLLRVTLDRDTATLGQAEVYSKVCKALTSLIATEDHPTEVTGVQLFRKGGSPVVSGAVADSVCGRFWL